MPSIKRGKNGDEPEQGGELIEFVRKHLMAPVVTLLLLAGNTIFGFAQTPAQDLRPELWDPAHVPFSFKYGGAESAQILKTWQTSDQELAGPTHRYVHVDPTTKLTITAEVRLYPDVPAAIDWVLKFRNDGPADTPIIENILPLDWALSSSGKDCFIHHARGSDAHAEDFEPLEEHFGPGGEDHLESPGGDPSSGLSLSNYEHSAYASRACLLVANA